MRFEGTLTSWNDERGFGYIESTQGGEPIFAHISAWSSKTRRPQLGHSVTFEVEVGPKGKRAKNVEWLQVRRPLVSSKRSGPAQWGTATIFAIPAFLLVYVLAAVLWRPPLWIAGVYLTLSVIAFLAYALDKAAATRGSWRTSESTLHFLSIAGGWPGALLAQQFLRHKSVKREFRKVFWGTVALNILGLLVLVSPAKTMLLGNQ